MTSDHNIAANDAIEVHTHIIIAALSMKKFTEDFIQVAVRIALTSGLLCWQVASDLGVGLIGSK